MRALVTGVTGQDGSYLAERLLGDGWEVHGVTRPGEGAAPVAGVVAHELDLRDTPSLTALLTGLAPDAVYNLAAVSSVARSWDEPTETAEVNGVGAMALMEAAWRTQEAKGEPVAFVQASSAEVFGQPDLSPQDERTPLRPVNPYGAAKAMAHLAAGIYRGRGLRASSLVLYNHESPRRPEHFVTRKITRGAAAVAAGRLDMLRLGNLDARRDWGWAPDYVDAMVRAAQREEGGDWVVATGRSHSVREFAAAAFAAAGVDDWEDRVEVDPAFFRPVDPTELVGDATRASADLGWAPTVTFEEMVARMVAHDTEVERTAGRREVTGR